MDETRKRLWDTWLTFGGFVATVVTIIVGVWQFNAGQVEKALLESRLLREKDDIDFQRRLWLERLNSYKAVAEIAGKIITVLDDKVKLKETTALFTASYWGTMILVEDKAVEKAMVEFMLELHDLQSGWSDANRVKIQADRLIKACRQSAEKGVLK